MKNVFISIQNRVHYQHLLGYFSQSNSYKVVAAVDPMNDSEELGQEVEVFNSDEIRHHGYLHGVRSDELADYYNELNFMLRRFINAGDVSEVARVDFIEKTVGFWQHWLKENNIELILFHAIPHEMWDYIVYLLAKKRKIKTVIIEKTFWPDRVLLTSEFRSDLSVVNISDQVNPYPLEKIKKEVTRVEQQLAPYWTRKKFEGYKENLSDRMIRVLRTRRMHLKNRLQFIQRMNSYSGFYGEEYYTKNDLKLKNIFWHMFWRSRIVIKRKLLLHEKATQAHRSLDNFNDKYIVFFLQVQPEKNTSPQGGKFYNQLETIRKIKSWLPDDVDILVREHPSQYKRWQSPHKGRDIGFYKQINDIGAKFICNSIDKREVVDKAIGIITVAGSVALESFMRGIHSAYIGHPWYAGIEGIYQIRSSEELSVFLKKSNKNIDADFIGESLQNFMQKTVPGIFEKYNEEVYKDHIEDWSYNIYQCIDNHLNKTDKNTI
jgi:hypothetical protein